MGRSFQIARIRGVPISVTTSWFALIVFLLYVRIRGYQGIFPDDEAIVLAVIFVVLFAGSVVAHEAAHAVVARAFGLPVLGITLIFWGGYTETPSSQKGPVPEICVSLAGPLTTLVMAFLVGAIDNVVSGSVRAVTSELTFLLFLFSAFNAVPAMPLDGGHALTAAVWGITGNRRAGMRAAAYTSIAVGVALMAGGFYAISRANSWWLVMLFFGWQMIASGRQSLAQIGLRDVLATGVVRQAMAEPPDTVPAEISLSEALDRYLRDNVGRYFPVVENGRIVGIVSFKTSRELGRRDPLRPVRDAVVPLSEAAAVQADDALDRALDLLAGRHGLVLDDGRLVGSLSTEDIDAWLRRRQAGLPDDRTEVGPPPVSELEPPARPDL
jgi:Zn-dependent protease